MLFCKSRMLRKKSLDSSFTGFTVGAGAVGGPAELYVKDVVSEDVKGVIVDGCGGCRATNAGMRRKSRTSASGSTESRYGSKQTKE